MVIGGVPVLLDVYCGERTGIVSEQRRHQIDSHRLALSTLRRRVLSIS